ncbi:MAG: ABC transporter ATP-binding protein [Eubacteriales bacterium]
MLELKNISWELPDGKEIIKDISLSIPDGKLVVITGPNGGGKTTLAKIIAGIENPTSGKILLDGEDITSLDITERAKRGISFAFQQPVRFKGISVRDILELSAGRTLNHAELCDLLGKVGLCTRDYVDREVDAALSGGEIKRIEIATVLARGTAYSIFDEPEAGIDLWSFTGLINVFEDLKNERHGTQVIISHQERILNIADEIIVIANGNIKDAGEREKILPTLLASDKAAGCPVERRAIR